MIEKIKENILLNIIRVSSIIAIFFSTLIYKEGFMFPGSFPKTIFLYIATSIIIILWLLYFYKTKKIKLNINRITLSIALYIAIMIFSGILGGDFSYAFWGKFGRMTGIVTMLYISLLYLVTSSVFKPKDWLNLFRSLLFSGVILSAISFLGINGLGIKAFDFLEQGGSLFSNNTFSGIYYLFIIFFGFILFIKDKSPKWRIFYVCASLFVAVNPDLLNFNLLQDFSLWKEVFRNPTYLFGTARASSVTLAVGVISSAVMYAIHRSRINVVKKSLIFGFLFFAFIFTSILFTGSAISQKGFGHNFLVSQNDFPRPIAWRQGIEAFKNKPLFGYGPNGFERAFQETLDPEISFIKTGKWFDKIHNETLSILVETGIVGILSILLMFVIACWYGFKHYRRTRDFSTPIILLLLVLHLIQIQTSFNINTSLLLVFLIYAYISSLNPKHTDYHLSNKNSAIILSVGTLMLTIGVIFTAIVPASHSYKIVNALTSGKFEKRMDLYSSAKSIYMRPAESVYVITEEFINAFFSNPALFNNEEAIKRASVEYNAMLDLFESHYEENDDNFRYVVNYAHRIHIGRIIGIDRLDRAGELIERAKELSVSAPQVFWLSSLQAKYTGNEEKALIEAQKALDLYGSVREKIRPDQVGSFYTISTSLVSFLENTKGSTKKLYFHIEEI